MKLKKNSVEILERINKILADFAMANGNLPFYKIIPNADDEYVGAIKFDSFMAYFCFAEDSVFGYSFMETPFHDGNATFGRDIALLTRFKFDFSEIAFSPYDIHNVINSHDFVTLDFHEMKSLEDAENNLSVILNFIKKNLVAIRNIATDANLQNKLLDNYFSDQKALDKKFDKEEFYEDIKLSMAAYEMSLYLHCDLHDGVDRFLCAGNYSPLIKKAIKLENKGKITVFEKRYTDYLVENGYPAPNGNRKQKRLETKSKSNWTAGITIISVVAALVASLVVCISLEERAIEYFFTNKNYIATIENEIPYILMTCGLAFLFVRILLFIPIIKDKTHYGEALAGGKTWVLKLALVVSIIFMVVSPIISVSNIKNNSICLENNQLCLENEPLEKSQVEIIYIQGYYEVDNDGNEYYVSGPDCSSYYIVFDGDYENHNFCNGLYDENGNEKYVLIKALKQTDYTVKTFKTFEEFSELF